MVRAAHSLFDPDALRPALAGRFEGPGAFEACRLFRSFINDVYQLEGRDGRLYYLRVSQAGWRSLAQVVSEAALIEAVAARGGRVARPVPLAGGGFAFELEAPEALRPAVLFEEAPGADLNFAGADGPANAEAYGRAAAALHLAMDGLPAFPDRPGWMQAEVLDGPAAILGEVMSSERRRLDTVVERLRAILAEACDLSQGMCHGDLNTSNLHFREGRATALDFDCAAWGWLANDIAAFARGVTLSRHPGPEASALIAEFLRGYGQVRPIPPADRAALPAFLLIQRIWVASLHLGGRDHRWGRINFGPAYVQRFCDWLEAWAPVLDEPPDWLI